MLRDILAALLIGWLLSIPVTACEMKEEGYQSDRDGLKPVIERIWCGKSCARPE